jgi:heme/copper-type cytochrome/quinol oxidase subunit 4
MNNKLSISPVGYCLSVILSITLMIVAIKIKFPNSSLFITILIILDIIFIFLIIYVFYKREAISKALQNLEKSYTTLLVIYIILLAPVLALGVYSIIILFI